MKYLITLKHILWLQQIYLNVRWILVLILYYYDIPDDVDTYLRRVRSKENLFFIY